MRRSALIAAAAVVVSAVPGGWAQEAPVEPPEGLPPGYDTEPYSDGEVLRQGAEMFLRGLVAELEPALREMVEVLDAWSLENFSIADLSAYHPPEMLENGDIILRRKVPLGAEEPPLPEPGGEPPVKPDPFTETDPGDDVEL